MNVFELVKNSANLVIIKVNADNNLFIAEHPYISGEYDYITVTKGDKHTLTIIKKDGKTFSFHWGRGGYTLISENLNRLKSEVIKFIEEECRIPLELVGAVNSAKIYFNHNFGKWQLTMNDKAYIRSDTARDLDEMIEWSSNYVKVKGWEHGIASTGIDVWYAVM